MTVLVELAFIDNDISTHTPLAGRDWMVHKDCDLEYAISTHTPLAGRDI